MLIKMIIVCLLCVFALGCTTQGAYLKSEEFSEIQDTVTTAQQLEEALGSPSVTIPRNDGMIMWVYEGVHTVADPTTYIPYLGLLVGTNSQDCTRLTVLVDRENGELSDWKFVTSTDTDYWANTDDNCKKKGDK